MVLLYTTRIHSSRRHTVRCSSCLLGRGGVVCPGGCLPGEGVCPGVCLPDTHPNRMTDICENVKTLSCRNYVADGNKQVLYFHKTYNLLTVITITAKHQCLCPLRTLTCCLIVVGLRFRPQTGSGWFLTGLWTRCGSRTWTPCWTIIRSFASCPERSSSSRPPLTSFSSPWISRPPRPLLWVPPGQGWWVGGLVGGQVIG